MGFAGQVFAARVAIGLAVPSPQAMSKTGGLLARGVAEIAKQVELARNRHGLGSKYKAQLDQMNATTMSSSDKINNEITIRVARHLNKMNTLVEGSVKKSVGSSISAFKKLEGVLSKPLYNKMTKGMQGLSGMKGHLQLAKNLQGMTRQQQKEILRFQDEYIQKQELSLTSKQESLNTELNTLDKGDQAALDAHNVKQGDHDLLVEDLENEKKLNQVLRERFNLIGTMSGGYEEMAQAAERTAAATVEMVNSIRSKFNRALRDTIAILTAMTYKLNQNTQELVEFERELLNANSVFGLTNDKLFEVGNTIIEFGNQYGIATQNGAAGLYQLASAGLEANEAMEVLPHTLKLSMAVQGDHNTISKLTAQTIFGFGMEMSDAAEITDKFAYAIQKSLIEYQDLSSAVKFALPFFTSTGQSLDQLLGALQILTNRALEAGIAGRGLRQALAEFAESAMDAEAGFRKMGVEILNAQGEMKQLDEIAAQFASSMGEDITNTELLTTLIQDLNVRGATAFIHLVQASDEFTEAVKATENAGGELDKMVRIQNESLSAQVQILKTNVFSIFALRDASYEGTEFINGFHEAVVNLVHGFRDLIIEGDEGNQTLTAFGKQIQDLAIGAIEGLSEVAMKFIKILQDLAASGLFTARNFELLLLPLKILAGILNVVPGWVLEFYLKFKLLNMILPLSTSLMWGLSKATSAWGLSLATAMGMQGIMAGGPRKMYQTKTGRYKMPGMSGPGHMTVAGLLAKTGKTGFMARMGGMGGMLMGGPAGLGLMAASLLIPMMMQSGGYIRPMAHGGSAGGQRPYLVGEQGPEIFMPGQAGQVLNNAQTNNLMGNGVAFKNVTIGIDSFGGIA